MQTAKAERAKTLLKARLAAASRRNKKKPKVGAEAGTEGCPPSDNGTASTRSGVSGSATTDSACRDGGREGREQTTAAAAAAVKGRDEAERQLGVTRSSLEEALAHVSGPLGVGRTTTSVVCVVSVCSVGSLLRHVCTVELLQLCCTVFS